MQIFLKKEANWRGFIIYNKVSQVPTLLKMFSNKDKALENSFRKQINKTENYQKF